MNILQDGSAWILPPRCAARYVMGILWKYGLKTVSYHDLNPTVEHTKIIMLIRNPYTRLRSWLRLWNTTLETPIDSEEYIHNLHSGKHGIKFVNKIDNPNTVNEPWKYPVPLSNYIKRLDTHGLSVDHFVRQECLLEDMDFIGYPIIDDTHMNTSWEPGDGLTDKEFYLHHPYCWEIAAAYYGNDFEQFGYSQDVNNLKYNSLFDNLDSQCNSDG